MATPVRQVTIVGGGTAGWLTATMLVTFLNRGAPERRVEVTLIESPNTPTIGVGEATVPGMVRMLRQLDIDERAFIKACNVSFKLGVRFVGWNLWPDGTSRTFFHPFQTGPNLAGYNGAYFFHRFVGPRSSFVDHVIANKDAVDRQRGPKPFGAKDYESAMAYAYHVDAGLFADFLREVCVERGVRHIRDDVTSVTLDERGFVAALELKEHGSHAVELVVDCTGFRGLIAQAAMGEPFIPWGNHLLCDSALAVQVPHEESKAIEPSTTSTALGAGWVWNVPLFNRVGTGYVYSSRFRSEQEALDEFLAHLGPRAQGREPRGLKMRIGHLRRPWVRNCVTVGLSSGFIEPLESTAIYSIEMAARWIVDGFPTLDMPQGLLNRYNGRMTRLYEEIRDFVMMHYLLSNRDEPFWRAAREEVEVPERLAERLEMWANCLPADIDVAGNQLFNEWNFLYVLYGKGFFDDKEFGLESIVSPQPWTQFTDQLNRAKRQFRKGLPGHADLLRHLRGEGDGAADATASLITGTFGDAQAFAGPTQAAVSTPQFDPRRYMRGPTVRR